MNLSLLFFFHRCCGQNWFWAVEVCQWLARETFLRRCKFSAGNSRRCQLGTTSNLSHFIHPRRNRSSTEASRATSSSHPNPFSWQSPIQGRRPLDYPSIHMQFLGFWPSGKPQQSCCIWAYLAPDHMHSLLLMAVTSWKAISPSCS